MPVKSETSSGSWQAVNAGGAKQICAPQREQQADDAADEREQHALCEQLADNAQSPGAKRCTNRHLFLPSRGPR
jgi:hypothetical protein